MTDPDRLEILFDSVGRLADLVETLGPDDLVAPAYPEDWTIAQVLSHLGSAAVISERNLEAAQTGEALAPEAMQEVWDTWNAKPPADQAADGLAADRALLDRLAAIGADERAGLRFSFGPMEIGFDDFVGFRINEHVVHSWDIAVAVDPEAMIPPPHAEAVIGHLDAIVSFTGRAVDDNRRVEVHTTEPARELVVTMGQQVSIAPAGRDGAADLELPAEALVRLVYGRLDPGHTPPFAGSPELLEELRRVFPGP